MFSIMLGKRDDSSEPLSRTAIGLLIALVVLIVIGVSVTGTLLCLRRRRNARKQLTLPLYNEKHMSLASPLSSPRSTRESILIHQESKQLLQHSDSPPSSPLPEIRVTFPEEYDASGKRTSGRVVVVRVGDSSVGLEPLDEKSPLYEGEEGARFQSVDLERVGGLIEKQPRHQDKMWS